MTISIRSHLVPRCPPEASVPELFHRLARRTDIPKLYSSDFYPCPRWTIPLPMPLHIFGKRVRRCIHSRFLRTESLRVSVFDYHLYVPLLSLGMGRALAGIGYRELDQRYILQRVVQSGDVILDLGANIGYYVAMYGQLLGGKGSVYAVEPDPRSVPFLRKNIELNELGEMVTVDCSALSDTTGIAPFFQAEHPNLSGLSISRLARRYTGTIPVPVQDFAEYLGSLGREWTCCGWTLRVRRSRCCGLWPARCDAGL